MPVPAGPALPSISAGPSSAGADASSSTTTSTGQFIVGGQKNPWAEALKSATPILVIGLLFWMMKRKK